MSTTDNNQQNRLFIDSFIYSSHFTVVRDMMEAVKTALNIFL